MCMFLVTIFPFLWNGRPSTLATFLEFQLYWRLLVRRKLNTKLREIRVRKHGWGREGEGSFKTLSLNHDARHSRVTSRSPSSASRRRRRRDLLCELLLQGVLGASPGKGRGLSILALHSPVSCLNSKFPL